MKYCPECGEKLNGGKFCPECGHLTKKEDFGKKVKNMGKEIEHIEKKITGISRGWKIIIWTLIILILGLGIFFIIGNTVKVPYSVSVPYTEQVPYQAQESYTDYVNTKNCDSSSSCVCLHKSYLGLGSCDSCRCTKYRTVTKYRTETKHRTETKYQTLFESWGIRLW